MNTYRGTFILSASHKEDAVQGIMDRIRGEITALRGVAGAGRLLGKRTFARPMKKAEAGLYAQMWFQLPPAGMSTLRSRLKLVEDISRCQIIRMPDDAFVARASAEAPDSPPAGGGGDAEAGAAVGGAAPEPAREATTGEREA